MGAILISFTEDELLLLEDALARAATRLEDMANHNPTDCNAAEHDKDAAAMRKLRAKIIAKLQGAARW